MSDQQEGSVTPEEAGAELKKTLRSVAYGETGRETGTERMRAAVALAALNNGIPSPIASFVRHVINGTAAR